MKRTVLKLFAVLLALTLLTSGSALALEGLREEDENFFVSPNPVYAELIDHVRRVSHSNSFTGSILIATDDEIILYGGPKALNREGLPVDPHTTYNIGSCSKLFTAVAVFQLIDAGRISLDDPLDRFFPEYETGKGITVWHLLHMQSGIVDYVNDPASFFVQVDGQDMASFEQRTFRDEVSDEEFLANLFAAPLDFEPGSEQYYSNTNYHLLALIIEQVSGMDFCDYVQANIFDPCGLEHTTSMVGGNETSVPKAFWDLAAYGIVDENGYNMAPRWERGAGGIHTCLTDLWTFDRALLSGRLVSETSLAEMMNFDKDYGCGLYPYTKDAFGHSGKDATYTSQNVIIDSEKFGRVYFIASTSSDAGAYALSPLLQCVFFRLGGM